MVIRAMRELLIWVVYMVTALVFISLAGPHPLAVALVHATVFPAFLILFFLQLTGQRQCQNSLFFRWLAPLLVWFWIQQLALQSGLPFWGSIEASWPVWMDFFSMFAAGSVLMLCAEEIFTDRDVLIRYMRFFVFLAAATGGYFIYLFYTSGVPVEKIRPPFFILEHLGPLGPLNFQPNNFIDLLIPPFFVSLAFVFYNHRRKLNFSDPNRAYSEIFLNLCFACVLIAAILFTKSRAGIIAFVPACGVFVILFLAAQRRRKGAWKIALLMLSCGILFLSSLGMEDVFRELTTLKQTLLDESQIRGLRSMTMGVSWQLFQEKSLLGVGLGNFQAAWIFFHKGIYTVFPERSYNDVLWLGVEAGLPGLVLFAGAVFSVYAAALRLIRSSQSSLVAYFSAAAAACLTAFILHSMVDPTLYVNTLLWEICILSGMVGALRTLNFQETEKKTFFKQSRRSSPSPVSWFYVLLLVLLAPVSAVAAGRLAAGVIAGQKPSIEDIEKVRTLDFLNSYYDRAAAAYYLTRHLKEPSNRESLEKALKAIDEAIRKEPVNVALYRKRAEILYASGDTKRGDESFALMQERLPDFYLGHAVMFAFYLEQSLEQTDSQKVDRLKAQALRNYLRCLELNPRFSKHRELYPLLSAPALESFNKLLEEKSLI